MLNFLLFLIIGLLISATINVNLLTIINKLLKKKEKKKKKDTTFCFAGLCSVLTFFMWQHISVFISYKYYT